MVDVFSFQAMATGGENDVWSAAATTRDEHAERAADLRQRQKELAREKAVVVSEIRNAEKKRRRRMERARFLSDEDLGSIIASRANANAKAKAKASAEVR